MSEKIIKDSLHGYISFPEIFFKKIIDTPIFQRLKRIEQTSMSPLFPSARHNRFIHSIGVYWLGKKALDCLIKNIKSDESYYDAKIWEHYGLLFRIACLLHDCAHAPFSHSFEFAYLGEEGGSKWEAVKKELKNSIDGYDDAKIEYNQSIDGLFAKKPSPHEIFSAIIVAKYYSKAIEHICKELIPEFKFEAEHVEFVQRAILGMKYKIENVIKKSKAEKNKIKKNNKKYNILNCLIQLLNSNSFDVDKLDYIMRDSTVAGINNLSVDVERILGALTIIEIHEFSELIKIDEDINNSINIQGKGDVNGYYEQSCALKLSLHDVIVEGKLDGSIEIEKNDYPNLNPTGNFKIEDMPNTTKKIIKGQGTIKGTINNEAKLTGSFIGNVIINNSMDGYMKSHIKGNFRGKIIGKIESWKKDDGITIYEIGYKQSALSVIDDTINARNRLYVWTYAHHKVTYIDFLLRYAVLNTLLDKNDKKEFNSKDYMEASEKLEKLLDLKIFDKKQPNGDTKYLLSDNNFMVKIQDDLEKNNTFAERYLSRTKEYSVWKNFAEYNMFFYDLTSDEKEKVWQFLFTNKNESYRYKEGTINMYPNSILKNYENYEKYDFVWIKPSGYKVSYIEAEDTYLMNNSDKSVRRLKDIMERPKTPEDYVDKNYFYLYTSEQMDVKEKFKLISFIKNEIRKK